MKVALIGGMTRLERHYLDTAKKLGHDLKVYNKFETGLTGKIGHPDILILFTDKVSHQVRQLVTDLAKSNQVPLFQYHSCGVCTLRECLGSLGKQTSKSHVAGGCRNCLN